MAAPSRHNERRGEVAAECSLQAEAIAARGVKPSATAPLPGMECHERREACPTGRGSLRERLRRRMHLVRMRASAMNRIFGLLTRFGLRLSLERAARP
jgi:hypothetical protein